MSTVERVADEVLAVLIESADDAVIVADASGAIRYWNSASEAMFGHSREDAVGASLDIIIPEKLRDRHWDGYRRVMATGETDYAGRMLAVPAVRADGSRISVEFTVTLLRDSAGRVWASARSCATSPRAGSSSVRSSASCTTSNAASPSSRADTARPGDRRAAGPSRSAVRVGAGLARPRKPRARSGRAQGSGVDRGDPAQRTSRIPARRRHGTTGGVPRRDAKAPGRNA
jgi:PAS domain S-box-containing protein